MKRTLHIVFLAISLIVGTSGCSWTLMNTVESSAGECDDSFTHPGLDLLLTTAGFVIGGLYSQGEGGSLLMTVAGAGTGIAGAMSFQDGLENVSDCSSEKYRRRNSKAQLLPQLGQSPFSPAPQSHLSHPNIRPGGE